MDFRPIYIIIVFKSGHLNLTNIYKKVLHTFDYILKLWSCLFTFDIWQNVKGQVQI